MRKRIVAAFLAVSLLASQFVLISMAEEGANGTDSTTVSATEIVAGEDEEVTEPAPQAESEAPVLEEGAEDALTAYAMSSADPAADPGTVSGTYANGMTWEITGEVLTISGNGVVDTHDYDYSGGIEDGINYGETIKEVIINEGATEIGEGAFSFYYYREHLDPNPSYNGSSGGSYWRAIQKVTLPSTITEIGADAFNHCSNLTEINIPNAVTKIGANAFMDCSALKEINIPEGVTEIGDGAFCHGMTGGGLEKIMLPDSIVKMGSGVFSGCENLKEVHIPSRVTEIGDTMFRDCTNLKEVHIPDGVTRIGNNAFLLCEGLTEINIPNSVTEIGTGTFDGCTGLKKIVIPSSVKEIGYYAFPGELFGNNWTGKFREVVFIGDAPKVLAKGDIHPYSYSRPGEPFQSITATAYYPSGNPTWTEEARMAIGSKLDWIAYEDLKILPEVTDNVYVLGGSSGATIACSGEFKDFVDVYVDDVLVDKENYTVAEGSTILTFASKYLNTLSVGTHKVTLNYTYGSIDTQLEILAYGSGSGSGEAGVTDPGSGAEGSAGADVPATRTAAMSGARITKKSPQTGDENRALPWLLLCFAAVCGGTAVSVRKKKTRG